MAYTLGNKCAKMFVNGQFHIKLSSKMWSQVFLQHWSGKWLIRSEKACILHSAIIACLVYNWVHLYILCTKLTITCTAKNADIVCLQQEQEHTSFTVPLQVHIIRQNYPCTLRPTCHYTNPFEQTTTITFLWGLHVSLQENYYIKKL